jgi:hypothetical protein
VNAAHRFLPLRAAHKGKPCHTYTFPFASA